MNGCFLILLTYPTTICDFHPQLLYFFLILCDYRTRVLTARSQLDYGIPNPGCIVGLKVEEGEGGRPGEVTPGLAAKHG